MGAALAPGRATPPASRPACTTRPRDSAGFAPGLHTRPRDSAGFAPGLHHTPILIQAAKEKVPVRIVQMMIYLVTLLYQLSIFDYQLTMEMVREGRRRRANYKWLCGLMCVGLVLNAFKFAVTCWLIREFLQLSFQR